MSVELIWKLINMMILVNFIAMPMMQDYDNSIEIRSLLKENNENFPKKKRTIAQTAVSPKVIHSIPIK